MAKFALLIGVSEYDDQNEELKPLLAAVKDVEAMRRVLVNPEMGDFPESNITVLTLLPFCTSSLFSFPFFSYFSRALREQIFLAKF
ncbi:MAG: hypothetical protein ACYTXA_18745 [Nostoc sp.]